jgi:predicted dehydrogenase
VKQTLTNTIDVQNAMAHSSGPLTVGIIGLSDTVRDAHLPSLLTNGEVHVAWLADSNPERAQATASAFKITSHQIPADLSQLPEAAIYLLGVPVSQRQPYFEALRDRGGAVVVDRPFAATLEQHREVCGWFTEERLGSGLVTRAWGPVEATRGIIQSCLFGKLERVRFGYGYPAMPVHRVRDAAGILAGAAVDGIDLALFATSARSVQFEYVSHGAGQGLGLSSEANLKIETESQADVPLEIVISGLRETIEGVEFEFENATISYQLLGQGYSLLGEEVDRVPVALPRRGGAAYHLVPLAGQYFPVSAAQTAQEYWSAFLRGLREQRPNSTSAAGSTLTTEVVERLSLCSERGEGS